MYMYMFIHGYSALALLPNHSVQSAMVTMQNHAGDNVLEQVDDLRERMRLLQGYNILATSSPFLVFR